MSGPTVQLELDQVAAMWHAYLDMLEGVCTIQPRYVVLLARIIAEDLDQSVFPGSVKAARDDGASWEELGELLGVTRSAARRRWMHLDEEGEQEGHQAAG